MHDLWKTAEENMEDISLNYIHCTPTDLFKICLDTCNFNSLISSIDCRLNVVNVLVILKNPIFEDSLLSSVHQTMVIKSSFFPTNHKETRRMS